MKPYLHGPMEYGKKCFSFDVVYYGTWTYEKEERESPVVGRRTTWPQVRARVAQQQSVGLT